MKRTKPSIVVADCICRKSKTVIDEGCGKTLEACFMFGSMGQYYLDRPIISMIAFNSLSVDP